MADGEQNRSPEPSVSADAQGDITLSVPAGTSGTVTIKETRSARVERPRIVSSNLPRGTALAAGPSQAQTAPSHGGPGRAPQPSARTYDPNQVREQARKNRPTDGSTLPAPAEEAQKKPKTEQTSAAPTKETPVPLVPSVGQGVVPQATTSSAGAGGGGAAEQTPPRAAEPATATQKDAGGGGRGAGEPRRVVEHIAPGHTRETLYFRPKLNDAVYRDMLDKERQANGGAPLSDDEYREARRDWYRQAGWPKTEEEDGDKDGAPEDDDGDAPEENGKRERRDRINFITAFFLIAAAGVLDLLQLIMVFVVAAGTATAGLIVAWIPIIGQALEAGALLGGAAIGSLLAYLLSLLGAVVFILWFKLLGVRYLDRAGAKVVITVICIVFEFLPFLNSLPAFLLQVVATIILVKIEDAEYNKRLDEKKRPWWNLRGRARRALGRKLREVGETLNTTGARPSATSSGGFAGIRDIGRSIGGAERDARGGA